MKRFVLACMLALPLSVVAQQEASAWFRFGLGGSFNTGLEWSCPFSNFSMTCTQACCPYPCPGGPAYAPMAHPPARSDSGTTPDGQKGLRFGIGSGQIPAPTSGIPQAPYRLQLADHEVEPSLPQIVPGVYQFPNYTYPYED